MSLCFGRHVESEKQINKLQKKQINKLQKKQFIRWKCFPKWEKMCAYVLIHALDSLTGSSGFPGPALHHWLPRWRKHRRYKYPPHVLAEECVCFNRNAKDLELPQSHAMTHEQDSEYFVLFFACKYLCPLILVSILL